MTSPLLAGSTRQIAGRRGVRRSRLVDAGLRAATAAALVVDAVVHLRDAGFYDAVAGPVVSQGTLFRLEAGGALLIAVLLVVWPARIVWAAALVVAATAAAAVLTYTYVDPGALGPLPDMYEPTWTLPGKLPSAVAEIIGALLAAIGLVRAWRRGSAGGDDADTHQVMS